MIILILAAHLIRRGNASICPNEVVIYECTVQAAVLEWRVMPRFQIPIEKSFIRVRSPLNSVQVMSWPHLSTTVLVKYTYSTSNSMVSTAQVTTNSSEFHEAQFTCSGDSTATERLLIAGNYTQ